MATRAWGRGPRSPSFMRTESQLGKVNTFWRWAAEQIHWKRLSSKVKND